MIFKNRIAGVSFVVVTLSALGFGCGTSPEPRTVNPTHPVVAQVGTEVRALTNEEANEICTSAYCEPNYLIHVAIPPGGSAPLHPVVIPTSETLDYSRARMNVSGAWALTQGSHETIVAVIDTGVQLDHPDLKDSIWADRDGSQGYDFSKNQPGGADDQGHGTHCAGIIAAELNGIGIVGVAPRVRIMPLKFTGVGGSGDVATAISAIHYAVAHGAKVISNSWSGAESRLLDQAVHDAVAKGVFFVIAAGNNNINLDARPMFPPGMPDAIRVGSSGVEDVRSGYSNYGTKSVWVMAPGEKILSSYLGGAWTYLSGTSMATPQVSGAIALALAVNPTLQPDEAKKALCETADPALKSVSVCGRIDIGAFVRRVAGGSH